MNTTNKEAHSDIEELLPWHAAGTLSRRDAQRVEEALARDPELARRYALVREELGETILLNETLGAPSGRAMEKLFAKIDAEPLRKPVLSLNLGARVAGFFASLSPRTLAWSASTAALAILLQAGLIASIVIKEQSAGGYETASAPSTDPGVGAFTIIRFAPQASSDDITKFLEANKLQVAAGPMSGGLYKVRVAVTGLPKAELARIVKKLQEDKVVGFIATTDSRGPFAGPPPFPPSRPVGRLLLFSPLGFTGDGMPVIDPPQMCPRRVPPNDKIADGFQFLNSATPAASRCRNFPPARISRSGRRTGCCANIPCATTRPSATAIWSRSSARPTAAAAPPISSTM